MRKNEQKTGNAQQMFNVGTWNDRWLVGKFRFAAKMACAINSWASVTSEWLPYQGWQVNYCIEPRRPIGRPAKRWDDHIMVSGGQL